MTSLLPNPTEPVSLRHSLTSVSENQNARKVVGEHPASVRVRSGRSSRLAASRILSETAHDLRSPLTSVRESIRLVRNSDLGAINAQQSECLQAAMDVCDSMERLVSDMLHTERLSAGMSRPLRKWFSLDCIRESVTRSVHPLLRPRQISVYWTGIDTSTPRVFGDADMIARLLTNLISNAAREVSEKSNLIVRTIIAVDQQSLIISVVDTGKGMDLSSWARISKRGYSEHGGEGLGLSICRHLASAHFSPLTILSRAGLGTEISFELPISGAASVASQWAQWRALQRLRVTPRRTSRLDYDSDCPRDTHRFFEDGETRLLMLHHDGPAPLLPTSAQILTVSAGAMVARKAVEAFDERLQRDQRAFDFVYRASERRWVVVWDLKPEDLRDRIDSVSSTMPNNEYGPLRLSWTKSRHLPIGSRHSAMTLVDMITHESLYEREPVGLYDDDMSFDGSNVVSPSIVPEERLMTELSRLSARLSHRSEQLHRQAKFDNS